MGSIKDDQSDHHYDNKHVELVQFTQEQPPLTPMPVVVKKQKLSEDKELLINADGTNSENGRIDNQIKMGKISRRQENIAMRND